MQDVFCHKHKFFSCPPFLHFWRNAVLLVGNNSKSERILVLLRETNFCTHTDLTQLQHSETTNADQLILIWITNTATTWLLFPLFIHPRGNWTHEFMPTCYKNKFWHEPGWTVTYNRRLVVNMWVLQTWQNAEMSLIKRQLSAVYNFWRTHARSTEW